MARRVVKKATSAVKRAAKKVAAKTRQMTGTSARTKKSSTTAARKTSRKTTTRSAKTAATGRTGTKALGDVVGVSRARVPKSVPRATSDRSGNPKGIELPPLAKGVRRLKPARARY